MWKFNNRGKILFRVYWSLFDLQCGDWYRCKILKFNSNFYFIYYEHKWGKAYKIYPEKV